ncbi:MAG: hypothetical protein GXO40_03090 [Epsilonproteobacteria bacterium]|nr:hypothetical protein [Campylobacterota bacterium]
MINRDYIIDLYVAMFQRAPTKAEVDYWYDDAIQHGYSATDLANAMVDGAVAATHDYGLEDMYPSYASLDLNNYDSIQNVIASVYKTLFDKTLDDDPDGIKYWTNTVYNHTKSLGQAILDIVNVALDIPNDPQKYEEYYLQNGYDEEYFQGALAAAKVYINRVEAAKAISEDVDSIDITNQDNLKQQIQTMQNVVLQVKSADDVTALTQQLSSSTDKFEAVNSFVDNKMNSDSSDTTIYRVDGDTLYLQNATKYDFESDAFSDVDLYKIHTIVGTDASEDINWAQTSCTVGGKTILAKGGDDVITGTNLDTVDGGDGTDTFVFSCWSQLHDFEDDSQLQNVEIIKLTDQAGLIDLSRQSEAFTVYADQQQYNMITTTNQNDIVYLYGEANSNIGDSATTLDGDDMIFVSNSPNSISTGGVIQTGSGNDKVFLITPNISSLYVDFQTDTFEIGADKLIINLPAFNLGDTLTVGTASTDGNVYEVTSTSDTPIDLNGDNSNSDPALVVYYDRAGYASDDTREEVSIYYVKDESNAVINDSTLLAKLEVNDYTKLNSVFDILDGGVIDPSALSTTSSTSTSSSDVTTSFYKIADGVLTLLNPTIPNDAFVNVDFNTISQIVATSAPDYFIIPSNKATDTHVTQVLLGDGDDYVTLPGDGYSVDGGNGEDTVVYDNSGALIFDEDLTNVENIVVTNNNIQANASEDNIALNFSDQSENGLTFTINNQITTSLTTTNQNDIVHVKSTATVDEGYVSQDRYIDLRDGDDTLYVDSKDNYTQVVLGGGHDSVYVYHYSDVVIQDFVLGEDKVYLQNQNLGTSVHVNQTDDNVYLITSDDATSAYEVRIWNDSEAEVLYLADKNDETQAHNVAMVMANEAITDADMVDNIFDIF